MIGQPEARLGAVYHGLVLTECEKTSGYDVPSLKGPDATTGFLLVAGKLWGFSLALPAAPLCR